MSIVFREFLQYHIRKSIRLRSAPHPAALRCAWIVDAMRIQYSYRYCTLYIQRTWYRTRARATVAASRAAM